MSYFLFKMVSEKESIALLGSFFVAINPMHVVYSQQLRSYIFLSLIYLVMSYCLYQYLMRREKKQVYWLGVLYALAFYIHFYAVFLVASHVLAVVLLTRWREWKQYGSALLIFLGGVLVYIPFFLHQFRYTLVEEGHLPFLPLRLSEISYPFFKYSVVINISTLKGQFPYLFVFAGVLSLIFFYGWYRLMKERKEKAVFVGCIFFGVFILSLLANPLVEYIGKTSIYYFRYFTYLVPMFCLLLAQGISRIERKWVRWGLMAFVLLGWMLILQFYFGIVGISEWNRFIAI